MYQGRKEGHESVQFSMSPKNNHIITYRAIIIIIYLWTLRKQQESDSKFLFLHPGLSSRGIHTCADVAGCPDIVIVTLAVGLSWLF